MASKKNKKQRNAKPPKKNDSSKVSPWEALMRVGLRSLSTGRFWQFCITVIFVTVAYKIDSSDWVRIIDLMLGNRVMSVVPWFGWVVTVAVAIFIHRLQRSTHLAEIERVVEERNALQSKLAGPHFESSKLQIGDSKANL